MKEVDRDHVVDIFVRSSAIVRSMRWSTVSRPILGGCFGSGGYRLTSFCFRSKGLDAVSYVVLHAASEAVISIASSRGDALAGAREVLRQIGRVEADIIFGRVAERLRIEIARERAEHEAALQANRSACSPPVRSIPRRRRQIFEASDGRCHYCGTALTLDGRWHIEHKMPRALFGTSEPGNLVASCVPCNLKKRDQTDVEFVAARVLAGGVSS